MGCDKRADSLLVGLDIMEFNYRIIEETRHIERAILSHVTRSAWTRMLLDTDIKLNVILAILFNIEDNLLKDDTDW